MKKLLLSISFLSLVGLSTVSYAGWTKFGTTYEAGKPIPKGDCLETICEHGCVEDDTGRGFCCPSDGKISQQCQISGKDLNVCCGKGLKCSNNVCCPEILPTVGKACNDACGCSVGKCTGNVCKAPDGSSTDGDGEETDVPGYKCKSPKTHWNGTECVCPEIKPTINESCNTTCGCSVGECKEGICKCPKGYAPKQDGNNITCVVGCIGYPYEDSCDKGYYCMIPARRGYDVMYQMMNDDEWVKNGMYYGERCYPIVPQYHNAAKVQYKGHTYWAADPEQRWFHGYAICKKMGMEPIRLEDVFCDTKKCNPAAAELEKKIIDEGVRIDRMILTMTDADTGKDFTHDTRQVFFLNHWPCPNILCSKSMDLLPLTYRQWGYGSRLRWSAQAAQYMWCIDSHRTCNNDGDCEDFETCDTVDHICRLK